MAGISSKALAFGDPDNRKKYNGIEKENDLQIEMYDAPLRELDGQTGRWWQIDPEIENMEMWSPYASNYDNPIKYMDPLGDDPNGCCGGLLDAIVEVGKGVVTFAVSAANAFVTNQVGGTGRGDPNSFSGVQKVISQAGQLYGDYLTMSAAVVVGTISVVAEGGTGGLASPVALPLLAQQVTAGITATKNIINDASDRVNSSSNSSKGKSNQPGSYTNTHESGNTYSGKGPESRAKQSADAKAKQYNDPVKKTDWKPAKNDREAFKAEDKRIQKNGGPGSSKNYNKIQSPGNKYNKEDNFKIKI